MAGKSYEWRGICDVCGFKKHSYELRKRWDGLMVCSEDWEPRNILDFYRTRNDAHRLPWTRPDSNPSWTPTVTGTITGSYTMFAQYYSDTSNKKVEYNIVLTPATGGSLVGTSVNFSLPYSSVATDKKGTERTSQGKMLGTVTAGATIVVPNFSITSPDNVLIAGSYLTP